ncbi:TonB-dependent receptor domain-containing protein [Thauera butanivorans]|uniref:TonB-dependent receptor domain-containing protein n=1 Tax=Thauera butanivorans TaxID=86174 RepID=UPI000837E054|nr:TonB-dependent receptor [Thauera butanivorans]
MNKNPFVIAAARLWAAEAGPLIAAAAAMSAMFAAGLYLAGWFGAQAAVDSPTGASPMPLLRLAPVWLAEGNDPDLKPEKSDAKELAFIREGEKSSLRVSLFEDDVRDAIFLQQQTVGATTVSTVQNVDRVRTRGAELAWRGADVVARGLDLEASLALVQPKTLENAAYTAAEGKDWPRAPRLRASLLGSYRSGPWLASLGVRHAGRQYGTLDNSDHNDDTFGGISSYTVADVKLGYEMGKWGSVGVGVDNLTDRRYYVYHPYPGRTGYVEVKVEL